jgi:nucleoid DNA-binding protein
MSVTHPLDAYIQEKIEKALLDHETTINKEDAFAIVSAILPEIDKLVAKQVKLHLKILGEFLVESLEEKEENSGDAKDS